MAFTFIVCEGRIIRPFNEKTGEAYPGESYDADAFIREFAEGVIIEISPPGEILKNQLEEAKRLLSIANKKLRLPGYFESFADEIERFLK